MGIRRRPNPQHDSAYDTLRAQLKQLRTDAGFSQAKLGELLDRPQTFVHKIESGDRRIDPVEYCRWCAACQTKPAQAIVAITKASVR